MSTNMIDERIADFNDLVKDYVLIPILNSMESQDCLDGEIELVINVVSMTLEYSPIVLN